MLLLGLDLSLTETGWALYDTNTRSFPTYGVIRPKKRGVERLRELQEGLASIPNRTEVAGAVLEGYSMGSRGNTFDIGEWGGIARLWLYGVGKPTAVIPPTTLKKFITGTGTAKKDLMLKELYKRYGLDETNDNIADAKALCLMAESVLFAGRCTKEQAENLSKVEATYKPEFWVRRQDEEVPAVRMRQRQR